jgi:hypothetical protein
MNCYQQNRQRVAVILSGAKDLWVRRAILPGDGDPFAALRMAGQADAYRL